MSKYLRMADGVQRVSDASEGYDQPGRPRGAVGRVLGFLMAHLNQGMNLRALEVLDAQPGERVLEIGFGPGRLLGMIADAAPDVHATGLDHSALMVERAGRRLRGQREDGRCSLRQGSVEALPFADDIFETVVGSFVFCSVAAPERGLEEIRRVLRPDGHLRMLEHVRAQHPLLARLQDLAQPVWTWFTGGCHPNRDTLTVVRRAGFDTHCEHVPATRSLRCLTAKPRGK